MNTTFIYALLDPRSNEIRYIGKSNNPERRLSVHRVDKKRNHRTNWIQSLIELGLCPILEILDEVPLDQWVFWEREYIRVFKALNMRLVNGTAGGEGSNDPSVETLAKRRAAMIGPKNPNFGKSLPDWHRQILSKCRLGKPLAEETKHKQRICLRANNVSGATGINFNKRSGKWRATISVSGVRTNLGEFKEIDSAIAARERALIRVQESEGGL